jgi:hypothetical protein
MNWLFRRRDPAPEPRRPHARPAIDLEVDDDWLPVFTCSTCGRTDLPEAGEWDPPICEECDAAINFDALTEELDALD